MRAILEGLSSVAGGCEKVHEVIDFIDRNSLSMFVLTGRDGKRPSAMSANKGANGITSEHSQNGTDLVM